MKTMIPLINKWTLVLTLGVVGMVAAANAQSDDFNRTVLGPNWTVQTGSFNLDGATVGGDSLSLMTFGPGAGQSSASMDVILDGSTFTQYGAIVLGYANLNQCAFIKIQDNGGLNGFDTAAFYYGNNGGSPDFFNITGFENVQTATISASLVGTVATLIIDSGASHAAYTFDYGSGTIFGTGVGLGIYGPVRLDNFSTPAVPEPGILALAGLSGLTMLLFRRRGK
jgi:hypothetical protein